MSKKSRALVAAVLAVCLCAGVLFSVRVDAAGVPTLFHNDEKWYKDSTAHLEMIDGIPYIPVDIYGMFPHIELSMDSRKGEFMLYNRTTGRYISVLYEERIATVDGTEEIYLNLYRLYGGYYYVPAEYFCAVLDLSCTLRDSDALGGKTMRIWDGTQTKTMEELLALYTGGGSESSSPTVSDTTAPPDTSGVDKTERTVYFTFNTVRKDNLSLLLETMRDVGVQATFFFEKEEMTADPSLVTALLTDGHSIGLTTSAMTDTADFIAQMDAANEVLYGITKMTTRIVQMPGGSEKAGLTETDAAAVAAAGYVLWDFTYDVPDSRGYATYAVRNYTVAAVRREEISVLRMSTNNTVAKILPQLLGDFKTAGNYSVLPIRESDTEVCRISPDVQNQE